MDSKTLDINEKGLAATDIKGDVAEHDDPEYTEYLVLAEVYSGDKLKKLTVSTTEHIRTRTDVVAPN